MYKCMAYAVDGSVQTVKNNSYMYSQGYSFTVA